MNKVLEQFKNNMFTIIVLFFVAGLFFATKLFNETNVRQDIKEMRKESAAKALERDKVEFMEGCSKELKKYECILMWNQK